MQERSDTNPQSKHGLRSELLEVRAIDKADGRVITLTLKATGVEPTPFGNNLKYSYFLEAVSSVPDSTLAELGFDVNRLRSLELAPTSVVLAQTHCTRETTGAQSEKTQKELMNQFERWIQKRDATGEFKAKIKLDTQSHVRRGPESRFRPL
jgi:hypothetical protein